MNHPIGTRIATIVWPAALANVALGMAVGIVVAVILVVVVAWQDKHA